MKAANKFLYLHFDLRDSFSNKELLIQIEIRLGYGRIYTHYK